MSRHVYFEELAAIAALGELDDPHQRELTRHLAICPLCKQISDEYEALHALRPALGAETIALVESRREQVKATLLTTISEEKLREPAVETLPWPLSGFWSPTGVLRLAGALAAVAAALVLSFRLGVRYEDRASRASEKIHATVSPPTVMSTVEGSGANATLLSPLDKEMTELRGALRAEKQLAAELEARTREQEQKLADWESRGTSLQRELDAEEAKLGETGSLLSAKNEELHRLEATHAKDSETLTALRYEVEDLTEKLSDSRGSLERERQLLASGRDIRDIIGARNLHIIDVYDTEPDGATSKSFARAFYTEGKSLIFYAYDLPARRTESGQFAYTAWGQRNGSKEKVLNLGILLSDDKGQRRWVLNFSDPKVLSEIDSVFITLERAGFPGNKPTGKRLLTAYLASQPNHP